MTFLRPPEFNESKEAATESRKIAQAEGVLFAVAEDFIAAEFNNSWNERPCSDENRISDMAEKKISLFHINRGIVSYM